MNRKNRCAVCDPVLRRKAPCKNTRPVRISAVTHIGNPCLLIRRQMFPDQILPRAVFMRCRRLFVIHTVHKNMGMAFCCHHFCLPPYLRFHHSFSTAHFPVLLREIQMISTAVFYSPVIVTLLWQWRRIHVSTILSKPAMQRSLNCCGLSPPGKASVAMESIHSWYFGLSFNS